MISLPLRLGAMLGSSRTLAQIVPHFGDALSSRCPTFRPLRSNSPEPFRPTGVVTAASTQLAAFGSCPSYEDVKLGSGRTASTKATAVARVSSAVDAMPRRAQTLDSTDSR